MVNHLELALERGVTVCISEGKGKKHVGIGQLERSKTLIQKKVDGKDSGRKSLKRIPTVTKKEPFQSVDQLVIWDKKDSFQHDEESKHVHVALEV